MKIEIETIKIDGEDYVKLSRYVAIPEQEWIDAEVSPPSKEPLAPPVWATIEKDGFKFVELVVYEEGMGWQITDDYRGELVRCEVGHGVITHWLPLCRPLYPAT